MAKTTIKAPRLNKATRELFELTHEARQAAIDALVDYESGEKPAGEYDNASRWYPDVKCDCCSYIRTPSRRWPFSFLKHTLSLQHKEQLHDAEHKDVLLVRKWLKKEGLSAKQGAASLQGAQRAFLNVVALVAAAQAGAVIENSKKERVRL